MKYQSLADQLVQHEGFRLKPYVDTVGKVTIGVGRNLSDVGISSQEAMLLLEHDIETVVADLLTFAWFPRMDHVRQLAVSDLRFNLGPTRFRTCKKMLAALEHDDYATAAGQLRQSRWYTQVKSRGPRIVKMLATGEPPQ